MKKMKELGEQKAKYSAPEMLKLALLDLDCPILSASNQKPGYDEGSEGDNGGFSDDDDDDFIIGGDAKNYDFEEIWSLQEKN